MTIIPLEHNQWVGMIDGNFTLFEMLSDGTLKKTMSFAITTNQLTALQQQMTSPLLHEHEQITQLYQFVKAITTLYPIIRRMLMTDTDTIHALENQLASAEFAFRRADHERHELAQALIRFHFINREPCLFCHVPYHPSNMIHQDNCPFSIAASVTKGGLSS